MPRACPVCLLLLLACGPFFYQAPPSLGTYPERIAAKRWSHLFAEAAPLDPALPAAAALDEVCRNLPETLAPLDTPKRLAEIDRRLAENRNGPYSARRANFLHELRELAADPALFDAAKSYVEWRVAHDTLLTTALAEERPWEMAEKEFKNLQQLHQFQLQQRRTFFKEQIAKAAPSMLPYWKVRRGAFLFASARHDEAAVDFSAVIADFAEHPRAEVASLMLARCMIEQSRELRGAEPAADKQDKILTLLTDAETTITEFIASHPKGRFTPDAEGWLGAIACDRGLLGAALKHQLARLDRQPTREITASVLRECDNIFEKLIESRDPDHHHGWLDPEADFDAAAIARHPLVARLFVQHCIDPAAHISLPLWWDDSESGGRGTIDFLKRRILLPKQFVRTALAELCKELVIAQSKPDATTLTLLAWTATEDGEHEQALSLLGLIQAQPLADEAMQARAIILQRLRRHQEAVAAFDTLAKSHPDSALVNDLPYRRSISLFQCGKAGKAIIEILPLVVTQPVAPEDDASEDASEAPPALHPEHQLVQWLDTLIQFAPLEELEIAFAGFKGNELPRDLLSNAIRTRALAAHRFDIAERYLTDDSAAPIEDLEGGETPLAKMLPMSPATWKIRVAPLAEWYAELGKSPPGSHRAKVHLAIARQWMKQRGHLTLPSLSICYYAASEEAKQELLRRRNALELGFSRETTHLELDHRDEATHALEHALEAAVSEDPAIAAPALELANECLFRRSEFSLYQRSRALETDASRLSADLHRQLRERFPESLEAKRAVHFTFVPGAGPWMPGDYNPWNAASAMIGALFGISRDDPPDPGNLMEKIGAIPARFGSVNPRSPLAVIRRDLNAARRELNALRPETEPDEQGEVLPVIDRLDDLYAAASLPGIRTKDFLNYANGIKEVLPPAFQSLLDFRERLKPMTDDDGNELGPKEDTIDGWRRFLELYPDSPKAEAASFRLTRLIARKDRPAPRIAAFHFPDAPIPNGYKQVLVKRVEPATDPAGVIAAIHHHERQFPMGRYQDDLNLLRAGALIDAGKFPQALVLLESILSNPTQRDLHVIAALEFSDIAQRLIDPEQRASSASAFRRTPGAINQLRRLVDGDTFLSRLKPLLPWLEE